MKETDAKEDRLSIAAYNTHHRSAAHTDPRFYPQGPKQMEQGDPLLFCSIVWDLRSLRLHVYVDDRGPRASAGCARGGVEVSTLTWTALGVTTFCDFFKKK